jgi:hypothetical protein
MKRGSGRPFTVEIKGTRTSRASLAAAATGHVPSSRPLQQDWAALLAQSEPERQPRPETPAHQSRDVAPARRVLPSLVPMFEPPSEPDPQPEAAEPKLPRVRRAKAKVERGSAAAEPDLVTEPSEPPAAAPPVVSRAVSSATAAPLVAVRAEAQPSPADRYTRREAALRPGEHWKRRLPRILR